VNLKGRLSQVQSLSRCPSSDTERGVNLSATASTLNIIVAGVKQFVEPCFANDRNAAIFSSLLNLTLLYLTTGIANMTVAGTLKKLVSFGSKPNASTFPELVNVIVWMRCLLAIGYGIHLSRGTVGGLGMLYGLNVVSFLPLLYTILLGADLDSYDNIIFAGVPNSLALMLLVWIYCYTLENADEEAALTNMIEVMRTVTTVGQEDGGAETDVPEAPKVDADSEF
jgi:hypothetical protein